ncbi:hypothetical protein E3E35_02175 [Thermococcus sp. GR7]|uniref:hypothetical protein n=1 Tax=Thermococcus sp. GR7 TaxID=1638257 RepID=UPI0014309144|nr:hypothetical protein [Thermococcus sp. GR7]NJE46239.1 hypothetical protein [Thermococcus sp. GR7]
MENQSGALTFPVSPFSPRCSEAPLLLEAVNPLAFLFLWAYYGDGVLLVREVWDEVGKGHLKFMLLGAVYGTGEPRPSLG